MNRWIYRGRWALVTGASSGLGAEFAGQLASRGMSLVLSARRADLLGDLAERLRDSADIEVIVLPEDLGSEGAASRLWRQATDGRRIDLLINNAGFGARGRFDELSVERQSEMVRVNCVAPMELAHLALQDMRTHGDGGIVNVASIAAFQPVPELAVYAATKAFILSFSEALWCENRDAGVRVVALCPGRTPTGFQAIAGTGSTSGSFGERSPQAVVRAALVALEAGRISVVPGIENASAGWLARVAPRTLLTRILQQIIRRRASK